MVQVWDVGVCVDEGLVAMAVRVATRLRWTVVLMVDVVLMLMGVLHRRMAVFVLVTRSKHEGHTDEGEHQRDHLVGFHGFAQD